MGQARDVDPAGDADPDGPGGHGTDAALELKSLGEGSPLDDLTRLLDELTAEMGEQFRLFRTLRAAAESAIRAEADGESREIGAADPKTARADMKGATDAMSLIVRTLEKIDGLQRQLARDRAEAATRRGEDDEDAAILERLERIIAQRVEERAGEMARRIEEERECAE